jgi:ATPase family protein associated with various cellular activities (AAA)/winged helix domain-containing protein
MVAQALYAGGNGAYLQAQLDRVRALLGGDVARDDRGRAERLVDALEASCADDLRLPRLARIFGLDRFERDLLLLAASADLDEAAGDAIAAAQRSATFWPTIALGWRLFCANADERIASRDALRPDAPLWRYGLLETVNADDPLPDRIVRVDRRIADEIAGRAAPDGRVVPHLLPAPPIARVDHTVARALAERLRDAVVRPNAQLLVDLRDAGADDAYALAAAALAHLGLPLLAVSAAAFPQELSLVLARESLLLPCGVLVADFDACERAGERWSALAMGGPLVFVSGSRTVALPAAMRAMRTVTVGVAPPSSGERAALWTVALGAAAPQDATAIDTVAERFELGTGEIVRAAADAAEAAALRDDEPTLADLCAGAARTFEHHMHDLAQRLVPAFGWDDLLIPDETRAKLRELVDQDRAQTRVLDEYGFRARLPRGRGVTALFAGPSGAGKTMASEVIAHELGRELYRVDLARVVSKYIGETEKNLRAVFHEAERARCVVLFDEADALFGKRTEVRDSRDRYANLEVSYLLQLMEEAERAVLLLATNRREAIDEAFLRRFRFVVEFPAPASDVRRTLWERSFPHGPVEALNVELLAERLALSPAGIKNVALAATFLAARDGGPVQPHHVAHAARRELQKMGRPVPFGDAELER